MSAGTTWPNTICITGKFIQTTMTKLKLFNYQSHPVLHVGFARISRTRLCFLSSLGCVIFRFSHTAICLMLYFWWASATDTRVLFPPITSTGRLRREGNCWPVRNLLWCSPDWYWLSLLNTSYCVVVTTVMYKLWMNELTGWIFHVCFWLYNIISMLGQSFMTCWTWDVCCWLYNIIPMPGHDL